MYASSYAVSSVSPISWSGSTTRARASSNGISRKRLRLGTGEIRPRAGRSSGGHIWFVRRRDGFLKDDVEPSVPRYGDNDVLRIGHRHQFLLSGQPDIRRNALPQQNALVDWAGE